MNALILGRRRQGKSTLALSLGLAHNASVVIFDPNAQFRAFPYTSQTGRIVEALESEIPEPVVVFRPRPGAIEDDFEALAQTLWPANQTDPLWENYAFLVDECSAIQSPQWLHPSLERLLRLTPTDITLIQTTHRLVDTHRLTRALATDVFLFHSTSGKDLAIIEQEFESVELAKIVSNLKVYQCAHYTIAEGGERKFWIWEDPRDWFLEIKNEHVGFHASGQREPPGSPVAASSIA